MKTKEELINRITMLDKEVKINKLIIEEHAGEESHLDSPLGKFIQLTLKLMIQQKEFEMELLKDYGITLMTKF